MKMSKLTMGKVERLASKQEKNMCNSYLRKALSSPRHEDMGIEEKKKPVTVGGGEVVPADALSRMLTGATVTLHGRESGSHP